MCLVGIRLGRMGLVAVLALQCVWLTEELLWYVTLAVTVAVYQHLKCQVERKNQEQCNYKSMIILSFNNTIKSSPLIWIKWCTMQDMKSTQCISCYHHRHFPFEHLRCCQDLAGHFAKTSERAPAQISAGFYYHHKSWKSIQFVYASCFIPIHTS